MNKTETNKYFDSLLLKTYDEYHQKNRSEFENIHKRTVKEENFKIPDINEYDMVIHNNYGMKQLKEINKYYKLKTGGKKELLIARIFSYLYLSKHLLKIQKLCKKYLMKKYVKSHGPAYLNRKLCVNAIDFLTMDELNEIIPTQFFSYEDSEKFIYGFDIMSFHNLIKKSDKNDVLNPYTKSKIPSTVIIQFKRLVRLSQILNIPLNLKMDEDIPETATKTSEQESIELFQRIDQLGNYTNVNWFLNLTREQVINLNMELFEIWHFRIDLSPAMKLNMCNTINPFQIENIGNQSILGYLTSLPNIEQTRLCVLKILERFVKNGRDDEYKKLGAYYVLGALTLVSRDARIAMPWLYDSFTY
jgi:hypothetical protein